MRHPISILCYIISITYIMPRALLSTHKKTFSFLPIKSIRQYISNSIVWIHFHSKHILFGDERELLLLWICTVWNSASKYIFKHHSMSPLRTGYTNESTVNVCQWISFYILHCRILNEKEGEKRFFVATHTFSYLI